MTWNIHGCIGTDGIFDPERTVDVINDWRPDVVALQEVLSQRSRARGIDMFAFFRERFGGHAVEAKSISTRDFDYGHMLISRWPFLASQMHDISVDGREPRKVLEARIGTPAGPLHVLATHLGLKGAERRRQFRALDVLIRQERTLPQVLMGDLNEWNWRGAGYRMLSGIFEAGTPHRTFPAGLPLLKLDRIWCRAGALLRSSRVARAARDASDHLPLIAEIELQQTIGEKRFGQSVK